MTPMPKDPIKREETLKRMSEAQKARPPRSEETRKKMSESAKKKIVTLEHRLNISRSISGINHPMFGKHHKEESKKKMSEKKTGVNHPNFGKHLSESTREKLSKSNKISYSLQSKEKLMERKIKSSKSHTGKCGVKSSNWRGGISFLPYCPKFNRSLKKNVRNFFGNKCVLCEKTRDENGMEFIVHHVFTEKMACCESRIEEMNLIRERLPQGVARFGDEEFSEEEIMYIRMMVPLCRKCHGKQNLKSEQLPYEQTTYRKFFTELILNEYGGKCYSEEKK
jgi:hypothetical protein